MNLPITVTVDVAKATAKLSGPLVLGNTYQVTFQGLTEAQAARHPTLVILGRPQLTNQLDEGGRGVAVPTVAAMSTVAGVLALNTQEMADVFSMAGLPPQAVAERACDARKPHAVLPGEVLHGAIRPHAALALHFYVTTQGAVEAGVDTSADSNGATLAQGDCTVHWAPFEFDGAGTPMILRGPPGATGPQGPAGIAAWPGCITFQIDADPASPLYGHLIAWAENRYHLYHAGNDGREDRPLEPHFLVCQEDDAPMTGMIQGHIYQIYYPETGDPELSEHRQYLDLGDVGGSKLFAKALKDTMDSDQNGAPARTLNETSGKTNSLWTIIKNACNSLLGLSSAFAIAVGAWLLAGCAPAWADEVAAKLGDIDPDTPVYTAEQIDRRPALGFEDGQLLFGTNTIGSGSLEYVWGPESFTNQAAYATNRGAKGIGIKPAETNANIRVAYDPETSTYRLQAIGGIPGPQGADGIGNVHWAGEWFPGIVMESENTWVTYDGSIWTRAASPDPVMDPPTNNLAWTRVVARGTDGQAGKDGHDAVGLQFVEWTTNLTVLNPDMLLSYGGFLLMITNGAPVANPGYPVVEKIVQPGYKAIVRPGADGAKAAVFENASFVFEFDPNTAINAHSLVVYHGYLWYAKQDYIPGETPPPSDGPYWACIGKQGERGPAGANGIGNLRYMGAWNQYRTNEVNDIVRWTRADGRVDWYRATGSSAGARPDLNTNLWAKEITSGTDANTIEWKFVDGPYDHTVSHSNELHRMPDGRVWYSVGAVPAGEGYAPGRNASVWRLFVRDGTSVAANTVWRGAWSQGEPYTTGDMVTWEHNGGNGLYIKTTDDGNPAPSDTDHWAAIATGLRGERGPAGADGAVTHITVTNIVTYEHAEIITNVFNVTNDTTTAIVDHDVPSTILHRVSFDSGDFDFNAQQGTFSLTEAALGVSTFNGWRGAVGIKAGSNIVFETNANHVLTISATVPEIDLTGYATEQWVGNQGYLTQHQSLAGYVTAAQLAQTLENYAPASDVTVIATNMEKIVSALSNPVIQTPDHRKWTMQGRYANGKVTHVWVPYIGLYSSSIRVPMPDGRIFEMVGRYADGNTNIITHAWEEVTE